MVKLDAPSFEDALTLALDRAPVKEEREIVTIDRALGRVLAEDLTVRKNLPAFDNSAMDGFAFRHEDAGKRLKVAATILAGDRPKPCLKPGECYRIMTGAQVPGDVDTVAPIEQCKEVNESEILPPEGIRRGANVRPKGEEMGAGELLLEAGTLLKPAHIALLGTQGMMAVSVFSPLKIAVLSTGNELREPWEEAGEDEIYNANAFGILALLESYGFSGSYLGKISDNRRETEEKIASLHSYDVVLTSGGISMGTADHLYEAFLSQGLEPLFHGVNVKPGRPTMMGTMKKNFVIALPGNPLATLLNMEILALPILRKMQGMTQFRHRILALEMGQELRVRGGRTELVLGQIRGGKFYPTRGNRYGSGMLTPLTESDAVAIFGEEVTTIEAGERIWVVLLGGGARV